MIDLIGLELEAILNANPEGCNQHTGPGCDGGGSVKGLTPEIDNLLEHVAAHGQAFPKGHAASRKDIKSLTSAVKKGWVQQVTKDGIVVKVELTELGKSVVGKSKAPADPVVDVVGEAMKRLKSGAAEQKKAKRGLGL